MEIDKGNLFLRSCRNVKMRNHLEDEMENLVDVREDSVVEVKVDMDNTK